MSIKAAEVKNIAALARLAIADSEVESYAKQLSSILTLVEQLGSAGVEAESGTGLRFEDIEPLAHPLDMTQRLRPDTVDAVDDNQRERYQGCAPAAEDGFSHV